MKAIPERLICQATLEGKPVAGVLIHAGFGVEEKNPYGFIFGPTNHDGCVIITREEVLKRADAELAMAMMDFVPLKGGFTGTITLKVLDKDGIGRAIQAYQSFHKFTYYPSGYLSGLESAVSCPISEKAGEIKVKCLI